jgi:DNA (cytosine-5)-methyltransferase 1
MPIPYSVHKKVAMGLKKNSQRDLKVLSLFSGCGGLDLGFEGGFSVLASSVNEMLCPDCIEKRMENGFVQLKKTRFKTIFANDININAQKAWVHFFSQRGHSSDFFFTQSLVDLVKQQRQGATIFPQEVDVVTGGFPCQDFSIAGRRNGLNSSKNHLGAYGQEDTPATAENRGQLYIWMKEVIELTQPNVFIAENVKGLASLQNVKEVIREDFSTAGGNGYIVLEPQILHAANFGVPQSRERIFFIGIKKTALNPQALQELLKEKISDIYTPYPAPTHAYTVQGEKLKPYVRLKEIFSTLVEPEETDDLSQKFFSKAKYMGTHCQGQREINPDDIGPTIRAEHHGNIEFRRLSLEHGGKLINEFKKGFKERRLTVRECALIQTFPPDYEFVIKKKFGKKGSFMVSPSQAYRIIGNAVPPLLAYNVAKRLEGLWDIYFNN